MCKNTGLTPEHFPWLFFFNCRNNGLWNVSVKRLKTRLNRHKNQLRAHMNTSVTVLEYSLVQCIDAEIMTIICH